jgi:hypothetical protein
MKRTFTQVPDVPTGAIFNPKRGYFSVVIPLERTNLITNPSIEFATTNYSASGGSIAQSATHAYHGAYSLAITPTAALSDGAFYGTGELTAGVTYAFSCKFKGAAGVKYVFFMGSTAGAGLAVVRFVATGRWQWLYGFWPETSTTTRRLYWLKDSNTSTQVFYVDGVQVESLADGVLAPTTYIDGDQAGLLPNQFPPPYRWNGTPHASTATRLVSTAAGGYVRNLDYYRFKALAFAGLGLTVVSNIATVGAGADGAQYQTTVAQSRQLSINGFWDSDTPFSLDMARAGLYEAVGPDHVAPRQPSTLFYQPFDGDEEMGAFGKIIASYQSGLEQNATPIPRENTAITFTQFLPGIITNEQGAQLTDQKSIATSDYILQRSALGNWAAMGTGGAGASLGVQAFAQAADGSLYVGGDFTSMGGVANTGNIAKWDGSAWSALTSGLNAGVFALAMAPNGTTLYVGGVFLNADGIANADRIASWNGSAWSALSTGANDTVNALAVGPDGTLYAGGNFTSIGGVAINRIAQWNGSAWSALAVSGADAPVLGLAFGPGGRLYAVGSFGSIGGVTANGTAYWDGAAWNAMGAGLGGVQAVAVGARGEVYAGGSFTGDVDYIGVWNGTGWSQLGVLNGTVFALHYGTDNILRAGGAFTVADGITLNDNFAYWNGATWVQPDISVGGTATFRAIYQTPNGVLYVGHDGTSSVDAAATTTVTNGGTARTYPTIVVQGPASLTNPLYQLINYTTGRALYFNYSLRVGEIVTIRTSPHGVTLFSNFSGDQSAAIRRGSSPDFALEKGQNVISLFIGKVAPGSQTMYWPVTLQSASDLVAR